MAAQQQQEAELAALASGVQRQLELGALGPGLTAAVGLPGGQAPPVHDAKRTFRGVVQGWDADRCFGFILSNESKQVYGKDVFLHQSEIVQESDLMGFGDSTIVLHQGERRNAASFCSMGCFSALIVQAGVRIYAACAPEYSRGRGYIPVVHKRTS